MSDYMAAKLLLLFFLWKKIKQPVEYYFHVTHRVPLAPRGEWVTLLHTHPPPYLHNTALFFIWWNILSFCDMHMQYRKCFALTPRFFLPHSKHETIHKAQFPSKPKHNIWNRFSDYALILVYLYGVCVAEVISEHITTPVELDGNNMLSSSLGRFV